MDINLVKLMEDGATIVTPTKRLSRHISYQFAQDSMKKKTSWVTPCCLPWESWCESIFSKLLFSTNESWILLNSFQQQWLWKKIIRNSKDSDSVLSFDETSKIAINCYKLCKEWDIPIFPKDIDLSKDAKAFKEWANLYERKKNNAQWLDDACLPDYIASYIKEIDFRSENIIFYGFDQLTKQQSKIRALLIDLNVYVNLPDIEDRHQTIAFSSQKDLDSEIHAAACWAKKKLKENNNATIGIIFRNISNIRGKLEYGFSSVLTPEKFTKPETTFPKPYSISMGKPLSTYPLIQIAINLLLLGSDKIPMSNLSELLNSPFIEEEGGSILDRELRRIGETQFTLSRVVSVGKGKCPRFISSLEKFYKSYEIQAKEKMKLSQWVTNFTKLLADDFEWPKGKLSSEEHQTLDKWNDLLRDLGSLAELDEFVDFSAALFQLKKILSETPFQPEIPYETPIQILGMKGVAGAQFDYLWITNARDDSWTQSGTYSGFIPYDCYKTIPDATPETRREIVQDITDKLVRSAENLVFSYTKREGDEERVSLSSLIEKYEPEEYNEGPEDDYRKRIFNSGAIEEIEDFYAPEIKNKQKFIANSSLLDDQSACPFRAFAKHRLHSDILGDPDDILDAAGRGILIHRVLEYLWRKLKTSDNLQSLSETKLDDIVCSVVAEAIENYKSRKPETFKPWFIHLEKIRLRDLLKEWLKIESSRSKFEVLEKEEKKIVTFSGIEFHLRVDRIDKLADDSYLIIDYKSGKATKNNWEKDRPKEPQLPLYAITSEYSLSGLAYAILKSGQLGFDGYTENDNIFPEQTKVKACSMKDRLDDWKNTLGNLTDEFVKGDAVVNPREISVCNNCHLDSFCRIGERKCER